MPLHVSSTCALHQEVKIALHSLWYHHTYRCIMQFWTPDDEHMCSKHVEAWNKLIVKQNFCASSWLITEINNICGFSAWNLPHVTVRVTRILRWLLDFWKVYAPLDQKYSDVTYFKKGPFHLQTVYFLVVNSKQYVMVGKLHAKTQYIKETGTGSKRGLWTYPEE